MHIIVNDINLDSFGFYDKRKSKGLETHLSILGEDYIDFEPYIYLSLKFNDNLIKRKTTDNSFSLILN